MLISIIKYENNRKLYYLRYTQPNNVDLKDVRELKKSICSFCPGKGKCGLILDPSKDNNNTFKDFCENLDDAYLTMYPENFNETFSKLLKTK